MSGRTGGPRLSIVVPAFNEAATIGWTIAALANGLDAAIEAELIVGAELVIACDHCTDDTVSVVRAQPGQTLIDVRAVEVTGPQGLGSAVRAGLGAATGDLVLYTDADLPFDPGEIPRMLRVQATYDADVLCGFRFDRTGEGARRALQSYVYNILARALLPVPTRDVNFACKMWRRSALDSVLPAMQSTGSFVDVELLVRGQQADQHMVHIGLDYFPRHGTASTLGGASAIAGILRDFRRLGPELRRRP